jgi:citrate/tricarballylate utilization protein
MQKTEDMFSEVAQDAQRSMAICNACRYCEGYCAVFPAMALQREFVAADMTYFANLCHNCNGCYHACQFSPPHPFGINLPQQFAELREESYAEFAFPKAMGAAFARNGRTMGIVMAASIVTVLALILLFVSTNTLFTAQTGPGAFYRIVSWGVMASVAGATLGWSIVALIMSAISFWRGTVSPLSRKVNIAALRTALHDAATLRYLGGTHGEGCNDLDASFSQTRRHLHHAMAYGFALCFASTSVATLMDHFLGWEAPYSWYSLPVILGTLGGIGMVIGTSGLIWVKIATDPAPVARKVLGGDYALLILLLSVAITGLSLLLFRATGAMGVLLAIHLGTVLALFVSLPYGKFIHGILRFTALLKAAVEREGRVVASD